MLILRGLRAPSDGLPVQREHDRMLAVHAGRVAMGQGTHESKREVRAVLLRGGRDARWAWCSGLHGWLWPSRYGIIPRRSP
jgi:hypothetical protein